MIQWQFSLQSFENWLKICDTKTTFLFLAVLKQIIADKMNLKLLANGCMGTEMQEELQVKD